MFKHLLLRFSAIGLILFVLFVSVMTITVQGQGIGSIDIDLEATPNVTFLAIGDLLTMTVTIRNNSIVSDCNLSDYQVSLMQTKPLTPAFSFVSPSTFQGPENVFTFTLIATDMVAADFQAFLWADYSCINGKAVILRPQPSPTIIVGPPQKMTAPQQRYQLYLPVIRN